MTPTPWDTKPTSTQHLIWDADGKTIAVVYTEKADAALIIRAVNAHEALVQAVECALTEIHNPGAMRHQGIEILEMIDAALREARA